ncbi:MAG: 3-hydroxyacyl-CoA dehydrogenase family protein, partial [Alphaproteobacteria bacterium]|nr:3-hydroxyacyl-CoA dehydrogenase family protein [Alphaproteobacteria bacterium]
MARVGVLGAGTMGHALALVHALGGLEVRLQDNSPAALDRAPRLVDGALDTLLRGGEVTASEADAARARIATTPDLATVLDGADL